VSSEKRNVTVSDAQTLKEKAYLILNKYPAISPKMLCQMLNVPYSTHKDYARQLRYRWKRDFINGLPSKGPSSQHHCRAFCYVPGSVDRKIALNVGWVMSHNRNRVLIFKDRQYGRIEWWETRRVSVHINKPQILGRVKQFLSNAFFKSGLIWDERVFNPWIESVQWLGAHDVYDTPDRLPYKVIDTYKEMLGFVFKAGDVSHPNSYEFEWCKPQWMERFELLSHQALVNLEIDAKALQQTSKAITEFNDFMKDLSTPKTAMRKDPSVV